MLADVVEDKEVRGSHFLNVAMVGVGFIPVVGWMVSGSYFLADIATLTITGNSIGGHLDNTIGEPLKSWKD